MTASPALSVPRGCCCSLFQLASGVGRATWEGTTGLLTYTLLPPFRQKSAGPRSDLWLDSTTCVIRQRCRQVERKRKKDKLHVSLEMLRDCLTDYHSALLTVQEAKSQHLSNTVSSSGHCPKGLLDTINAVVNPCTSAVTQLCSTSLNWFLSLCPTAVETLQNSKKTKKQLE